MSTDQRPSLLITGAAGGLAQAVSSRLIHDYRLIGVDSRPLREGRNFPGEFHLLDYNHRKMADLFRTHSFHAVLHIGRLWFSGRVKKSHRYKHNVLGTRNLLELIHTNNVKNLVVMSTFHVYGAHQHNSIYLTEDSPLRASQIFPELADAVELDQAVTTFLWKHRDIRTVLLRPSWVVGPKINNTITEFLRREYCPILWGYDPLMQFIHESDLSEAIFRALLSDKSGIYNISGEGVLPYSKAISISGSRPVSVPAPLAYSLMGALSRFKFAFPKHLIDYFRYPVVISDKGFKNDFGFSPTILTTNALQSIRGREI